MTEMIASDRRVTPLESFLRDYLEATGGLWDEIEPQVYDLLLPRDEEKGTDGAGLLRVTFDPEALAEHPHSQLASYGTPLVEQLFRQALQRGRYARVYRHGLNLAPHGLHDRVRRTLSVPESFALELGPVRPLSFCQAVFWFEATFISDQKEHELLHVAMDLHYMREVRHLEKLLDREGLADAPATLLPEAKRANPADAYPLARQCVLRSLAALANARTRELHERLARQIERMDRYYSDLRAESDEQEGRARERRQDVAKFATRREAVDREQQTRVAELRQKNTLRVELRLLNLLLVHQPKLLVDARVAHPRQAPVALPLVWDPLVETLEAAPCPACLRPTYALVANPRRQLGCPDCFGRNG